jgi:hypothetical protein
LFYNLRVSISGEFCSCRCRIQMRCIVCTLMQEESTCVGVVATVSNFFLKLFGDWHPTLFWLSEIFLLPVGFFLWKRENHPTQVHTEQKVSFTFFLRVLWRSKLDHGVLHQ